MTITEKQIHEERRKYMNKIFTVNNDEAKKSGEAYLAGVKMVLLKTGMSAHCENGCDPENGKCKNNDCMKFYF